MTNANMTNLTIRDYFAAAAMQGFCATGVLTMDKGSAVQEEMAKHAYAIADALMKAAGG